MEKLLMLIRVAIGSPVGLESWKFEATCVRFWANVDVINNTDRMDVISFRFILLASLFNNHSSGPVTFQSRESKDFGSQITTDSL